MTSKSGRKLVLSKETVRDLTSPELKTANGGMRKITEQPYCFPSGATWFAPCGPTYDGSVYCQDR
ncbi:MAG TPA: hypothetical protein VND22_01045 [Actinomycetota bacterium]|nr:hypothetical protein [Actinomycetota bacterium]